MKVSKELKTGILVFVSFALLLWGISFLRGNDLFSSTRKFYVKYDNVYIRCGEGSKKRRGKNLLEYD